MLSRFRPALGALPRPAQFRPLSTTAVKSQTQSAADKEHIMALGDLIMTRNASPLANLMTQNTGDQLLQKSGNFENVFEKEPYHLNVYSTRHNTHISFSDPKKNNIISLSAGNIGFKKAARGKYDAAYQLAAKVFKTLSEDLRIRPPAIEVVLRGFGQGRDAVMKALMGNEGRHFKNQVTRITDSTRLKFGGTRSKKPRRLG